MKLLRRIIIFMLLLFVIGLGGLCFYFSSLIVDPGDTSMETNKDYIAESWGTTFEAIMKELPTPEDFEVLSPDGVELSGWYFDNPDSVACGVVLAHGWGSTRVGMLKYKDLFWDCGCDLVFFDHRLHSESGGDAPTAGIKEKADLIRVTEWLQDKTGFTNEQIAWMGESWGGATVLQAGALNKDVAFIVSDSPFQDWETAIFERAERLYGSWTTNLAPLVMGIVNLRTGVDYKNASPLNQMEAIEEPIFLIHSQQDSETASFQSVNLAKKLNPDNSEFYHTDWGSDHVMDVINRPREYKKLLNEFILEKVGGFGNCQPVVEENLTEDEAELEKVEM